MKIVKDFIFREIAGEQILVPTGETSQEFNGMITMTETAGFIWNHLEEAKSLEELVQMLTETYDVSEETARRDTIGLINELMRRGIVECTKDDRTW